MLARMKVTPEFCRAVLRYEPETGKLFWKHRDTALFAKPGFAKPWNERWAGEEAFKITHVQWGHKQGTLGGKCFKAHIVIWAIVHGEWPKNQIDHINGEPADNRIDNLRDVPGVINVQNSSRYKSNSSGVTGVWWSAPRQRWMATIKANRRKVYLGSFRNLADAAHARKHAEAKYGFHPNHGRAA